MSNQKLWFGCWLPHFGAKKLDQTGPWTLKHWTSQWPIILDKEVTDSLAWFWRIEPSRDALTGEWLKECKLNLLLFLIVFGYGDMSSLSY